MSITIDYTGSEWTIQMDEQWDVTEKQGKKIVKDFWKQKIEFSILRPREDVIRFDMSKYSYATRDYQTFMVELQRVIEMKGTFIESQLLTDIVPEVPPPGEVEDFLE